MSTIAGVVSFLDQEKFRNTQEFQDVSFLIKVKKSEDEEKTAELYFLDGDPITEIPVPNDIECEEINELDQKTFPTFSEKEAKEKAAVRASVDKMLADIRLTLPSHKIKPCENEAADIYKQALNFSLIIMILLFISDVMLGMTIHISLYAKDNLSELKELYESYKAISEKNKHFYYKF
ncbi:21907_t:CDS:2 [Dentiscutata erythropus]|uniref:21907_t:CDS:1 n=1 Tax=Dentiscutata erythropus TaxID=1348616 RepID=A0A9N8VW62_9GLOM|nr:21907_t:CDS:2 [Dentiscutata erythropus]